MASSAAVAQAVVETASGASISKGVWTGVVIATIGLIGLIVRQWAPWMTITASTRRADMEGMGRRIAELEARLDRQTTSHDLKVEQERAQHVAEQAIMRHRMNNLDQCLTMLLMLIEQDPEKAREAASRVRTMRERQEANEAAERAAIHVASIAAKVEPAAPAA
jgi:hypothetical protein